MKHAILITAYKDLSYLLKLINSFDEDFNIYIHIDTKTIIPPYVISEFKRRSNVRCFIKKYSINWGSMNHVKSILYLCKKALSNSENEYIHLISGSDCLIKNIEFFKYFFRKNRQLNFLEFFTLPNSQWSEGGLNRLEWYHPLDNINIKSPKGYRLYSKIIRAQQVKGKKRELPTIPLYGGSTWWSLSRECVHYIIINKNIHGLYDRMHDTLIPEEIYIPTIIMNSPFAESTINDELRYICWEARNGNIPAILDISDLIPILKSNCFFARKIEWHISSNLFNTLHNITLSALYINENSNSEQIIDQLFEFTTSHYNLCLWDGLYYGKMGIIIFMFYYAQFKKDTSIKNHAYSLLEHIIQSICNSNNSNYEDGIIGVATGIEYLFYNGFIQDDTNDLLREIDDSVFSVLNNHIHSSYDANIINIVYIKKYLKLRSLNPLSHDKRFTVYLNYLNNKEHFPYDTNITENIPSQEINLFINSIHIMGLFGYSGVGIQLIDKIMNKNSKLYLL